MPSYNKTQAPVNWTATADSILEKLQRLCAQISMTEYLDVHIGCIPDPAAQSL